MSHEVSRGAAQTVGVDALPPAVRSMLRIRMVDESIADRYVHQEMRCPVHLSIGQEAVAAGIATALRDSDAAVSTHRAHAHYLAKGGDLRAMIAEIHGRATGCSGGMGGSMHLVDLAHGFMGSTPIVGGSLPVGVGIAFAAKQRGEDRVTAVFFGEGATEEGVFYETLNFAALHSLPVVFVCENNLYSVYSPLGVRQPPARDLGAIARGIGVAHASGDGNDLEAVETLAASAVEQARSGRGPTILELSTYRWREHCGPNYDNDIGYRTVEEFEHWKALDPVERARAGVSPAAWERASAEIAAEIDEAYEFALASPFPGDTDLPAPYAPPGFRTEGRA